MILKNFEDFFADFVKKATSQCGDESTSTTEDATAFYPQ